MELEKQIRTLLHLEEDDSPDVERIGDSLIIDCRECDLSPLPGSKECIRCMVGSMSTLGGAERVVLRTGRDIEISGQAGRLLKKAASLRRWSMPVDTQKGRCSRCPANRTEVMINAWNAFPSDSDPSTLIPSTEDVYDREECRECIALTARSLEQMKEGLDELQSEMENLPGASA